jgi:heat-inducible transcriptional repressor
MELGLRKNKILAAVVESYIATGEPVASKHLLTVLENSVSSATVRNEMAELTELGLLEQPHTSAGRVPSQTGYRYYIDHLMKPRELSDRERQKIEKMLSYSADEPEKLISEASLALSELTGCASIFTSPADEKALIDKIELVLLSPRTAILALLTTSGILKTRILRFDSDFSAEAAKKFNVTANKIFKSVPAGTVTQAAIQSSALQFDNFFAVSPVLFALSQLAGIAAESSIKLEGKSNLLLEPHGIDAHLLLSLLKQREILKKLSDAKRDVSVGLENGTKELSDLSVIISKYSLPKSGAGVLGVIGSTRMDYASLIPQVKYLANLVEKLLTELS